MWLQFSLDAFPSLHFNLHPSYYCVHRSGTRNSTEVLKAAKVVPGPQMCTFKRVKHVTNELCSYYQSVRCLFLLLVLLLRHGGCRLSWLGWRLLLSSRWARGRRIHKHFIRHSEAYLLSLVHVQVMRSFIRLILPNPNLLCFIAAAVVKDNVVALLTANLNNDSHCVWGLCTARI